MAKVYVALDPKDMDPKFLECMKTFLTGNSRGILADVEVILAAQIDAWIARSCFNATEKLGRPLDAKELTVILFQAQDIVCQALGANISMRLYAATRDKERVREEMNEAFSQGFRLLEEKEQ